MLDWALSQVQVDVTAVGLEGSDSADTGAAESGGAEVGTHRVCWFLLFLNRLTVVALSKQIFAKSV